MARVATRKCHLPVPESSRVSDARRVSVFVGSYVVFAIGKFPWMKIDRPGAATIGAVLMVAFGIVGTRDAMASIDFGTIVLLFSMMLIVANLRLGGFFDWVTGAIIERLHPKHLLPVVVFTSGCLSALLVNDVVCLVMTPFVIGLTRRLGLRPVPYLLAVALASNVGSVATITGNPQNMLIGSLSGISYLEFAIHLGPVAIGGLGVTWALLHWLCLPGGVDRAAVADALAAPPACARMKPVVVLAIVFAGFLAGVPAPLMAAIGQLSCSSHVRSSRSTFTTMSTGGSSSSSSACSSSSAAPNTPGWCPPCSSQSPDGTCTDSGLRARDRGAV